MNPKLHPGFCPLPFVQVATNPDGTSRRSTTVTAVPGCTRHTVVGDGETFIEAEGFTALSGDVDVYRFQGYEGQSVDAKLDQGVLHITLNKRPETKRRKIEVHG